MVDELQELVYFRGWGCAGFCVLLWTCEGSVCTNGAGNLRAKLQEQQGSADEMSPLLTQHPGDTGVESLWGWDQFGLQNEFQTSFGYRVRPCIKNTNDNNNKKIMAVTAATVLISPWFSGCDVELCWFQSGNSFHFSFAQIYVHQPLSCPDIWSSVSGCCFSCPHEPEDLLDKEIGVLLLNKSQHRARQSLHRHGARGWGGVVVLVLGRVQSSEAAGLAVEKKADMEGSCSIKEHIQTNQGKGKHRAGYAGLLL